MSTPSVPSEPARLPDDPDLGWLRKAAKRRARTRGLRLNEAQRDVARHFGFGSWSRLKFHVELVRSYRRAPDEVPEQADPAAEILRLGCLAYSGQDSPARRSRGSALLAARPELVGENVHLAAARADVAALRRLLDADPARAVAEGGPFRWAPLSWLAYARLEPVPTETDTLAAARLLLEFGADPDTGYLWHGLPSPFTTLTGCFGEGEGGPDNQPAHPHGQALARVLLDAGADANDGQTLYNRQFRPDDSHLELLLAYGLGRGDGGPWKRRLGPAADPPHDMLRRQLAWAAAHGFDARIRLLAPHVDLDARTDLYGAGALTALELAQLSGHRSTADLLTSLGVHADLSPVRRVVAAVLAGDPVAPTDVPNAVAARPGLVAWAAARGDQDAVRRAVELGWDPDRRARTDVPSDQPWETGLHAAAGAGDVPMICLLLSLGASPDVRDARFDATPLQWAEHLGQPEAAAALRDATEM